MNKCIKCELAGVHYTLTRLDDGTYHNLWQNSLAIEDDYGFYMTFARLMAREGRKLNFAQMYVALKELCGESSNIFDNWKSSFLFPFLLEVAKADRQSRYLFRFYNYRDSWYCGLRKVLDADDTGYDKHRMYQPFEDEFSRDEINYLIAYFYSYLFGFFEAIHDYYDDFFFKRVDSNLILFGYKDGEFFEEQYDTEEEYLEAIDVLEEYARHFY